MNASNFCCVIDSILVEEILSSLTISACIIEIAMLFSKKICALSCPISLAALFLEPESSPLHQTCVQIRAGGNSPPSNLKAVSAYFLLSDLRNARNIRVD